MKKTRCHPTKDDTVFCLVGDYAISENFIIANRVLIDAAAIAGVALDGVDNAVFDFLNRHIRCKRIAGSRCLFLLPIGGVQHQAACVLCKTDASAVLFIGGRLHSRAGAGLFIPRREDRLFSAASATALT